MYIFLHAHGCKFDVASFFANAFEKGNLEKIKWFAKIEKCIKTENWNRSASWGDMHILEWGHDSENLKFDASICASASFGAQLETLKWLRSRKCPWDERVCDHAVEFGYEDLFCWAADNGAPINDSVPEIAARRGCLKILECADEHGVPYPWKSFPPEHDDLGWNVMFRKQVLYLDIHYKCTSFVEKIGDDWYNGIFPFSNIKPAKRN
jgi:hypothetical protein